MPNIRSKDEPRVTAPTAGDALLLDGATTRSIIYTDLQAALDGGQIHFPATQIPSSDPNTLDDYEEGNWTPALSFVTPGNLSVGYQFQTGRYTKIGRLVVASFAISTSSFTFSTATGNLVVNGLPFSSVNDANYRSYASVLYSGITKAGYTQVTAGVSGNVNQLLFGASGSGVAQAFITAADMPSGGSVLLIGTIPYIV